MARATVTDGFRKKYRLGGERLRVTEFKWSEAGNFQGIRKEGDLESGCSMFPGGRGGGTVYPSAEV